MACGKVLWINTFLWHRHPISKFGEKMQSDVLSFASCLLCSAPQAGEFNVFLDDRARQTHTQQPSPSRLSGKAEPERFRVLFRVCFRKLG